MVAGVAMCASILTNNPTKEDGGTEWRMDPKERNLDMQRSEISIEHSNEILPLEVESIHLTCGDDCLFVANNMNASFSGRCAGKVNAKGEVISFRCPATMPDGEIQMNLMVMDQLFPASDKVILTMNASSSINVTKAVSVESSFVGEKTLSSEGDFFVKEDYVYHDQFRAFETKLVYVLNSTSDSNNFTEEGSIRSQIKEVKKLAETPETRSPSEETLLEEGKELLEDYDQLVEVIRPTLPSVVVHSGITRNSNLTEQSYCYHYQTPADKRVQQCLNVTDARSAVLERRLTSTEFEEMYCRENGVLTKYVCYLLQTMNFKALIERNTNEVLGPQLGFSAFGDNIVDAARHTLSLAAAIAEVFENAEVIVSPFVNPLKERLYDMWQEREKFQMAEEENEVWSAIMDMNNNDVSRDVFEYLAEVHRRHNCLLCWGAINIRFSWDLIVWDMEAFRDYAFLKAFNSIDIPYVQSDSTDDFEGRLVDALADNRPWVRRTLDIQEYPHLAATSPTVVVSPATAILPCTFAQGVLQKYQQADWYSVEELVVGRKYIFETSGTDTVVILLGEDMNPLFIDDDGGSAGGSKISFEAHSTKMWTRVTRFHHEDATGTARIYSYSLYGEECLNHTAYPGVGCPPGHALSLQGEEFFTEGCAKEKFACPVGFYSPGGLSTCSKSVCPSGQYPSMEGQSMAEGGCVDASPGQYAVGGNEPPKSSSCEVGQYATGWGNTDETEGCTTCDKGTMSLGGSVTYCVAVDSCFPGHVADKEGAVSSSDCSQCQVGTWSLGGDAKHCSPIDCPYGYYATKSGAITADDGCVPCGVGKYSDSADSTTCEPVKCPLGHIATAVAATSETDGCEACEVGHFSDSPAATTCKVSSCPAGSIPSKVGAISAADGCTQCAAGKYAPSGAHQCYECPEGETSNAGSSSESACSCKEGYIRNHKGVCKHVYWRDDSSCPSGYTIRRKTYAERKCKSKEYWKNTCDSCTVAEHTVVGTSGPNTCTYEGTHLVGCACIGVIWGKVCTAQCAACGGGMDTCVPNVVKKVECIGI